MAAEIATVSSIGAAPARAEVGLARLYALRFGYLVLAAGLGTFIWPSVIQHDSNFASSHGVPTALLAGLGLIAMLGFRYPLQMLPVLLFELTWKTVYLIGFALPLWRTHQLDLIADDLQAVLMVVIFVPLIPWRYVYRNYLSKPSERWR